MRLCDLKYLLLCGFMLLLVACSKSELEENNSLEEEATSLKITFKSAENRLLTRGVEDLNDDGVVSETELYIDGKRMYRLGIFLANSEGVVVTSTVLEADDTRFTNNNTEAEVEFNNLGYDETYTLYAVANYGNYEDELVGVISDITDDNVTGSLQVQASTDNICNRSVVYPLSLKKEITMEVGENTVTGYLERTFARMRISVCNQSTEKLTVTNLSFPNMLVQKSADVFFEGWGTANVTPIVTSEHAITPFQPNVVVPKKDDSGNVTETTIFDSYLLESNSGTFNYKLDLKLGGDAGYKMKDGVQLNDRNNVNNNNKGPLYLIYNVMSQKFLCVNPTTKNVELGTSYGTDAAIDPNYVWEFERPNSSADNFSFFIKSMGVPGSYLHSSQASANTTLLTDTPSSSDYFQLDTQTDRLVLFKSNYYLAVDNNRLYWHNGRINGNRTIQQFCFYEVSGLAQSAVSSITHSETIPIKINGEALTAINRNDFINIVVNVNYSGRSRQVSSTCVIE